MGGRPRTVRGVVDRFSSVGTSHTVLAFLTAMYFLLDSGNFKAEGRITVTGACLS